MIVNPVKVLGSVGTDKLDQNFGIYLASVANINDPARQNRVQLTIPQVLGTALSNWARPMALLNPPRVSDTVFAMFVGGDLNVPIYIQISAANPNTFVQGVTATITVTAISPSPSSNLPDQWKNVTNYSNGWSAGSGGFQYRLSEDRRSVLISGTLNTGTTTTDSTVIFTMPAAYSPNSGKNILAKRDQSLTDFDAAIKFDSNGNVECFSVSNATNLFVESSYVLDR